jgi:2-amino-4-hydroxy-6-hydroxymethyldihydropteridine diphosphokinase
MLHQHLFLNDFFLLLRKIPPMHKAYLSLGSNQGDRIGHLAEACLRLQSQNLTIIKRSPIYETAPWGFAADTPFLNAVIEVHTSLEPEQLHQLMMETETSMGRKREAPGATSHKYTSRCIDLDLLFYDDLMLDNNGLTIPHPRLHLRNFVLAPLADIAPDFTHPAFNLLVNELLSASSDTTAAKPLGSWQETISSAQIITSDPIHP